MITTAIALLTIIQGPQRDSSNPDKTTAAQIMSKVFSRYADAQTAVGTVKMTQTALDVTLNIDTELQFDRPGKIYLHQTRNGTHARQWLLTSNGKVFSYDRPDEKLGRDRYQEWVNQNGVEQKIGDLYMASEHSLGELNAILDVAISQPGRLKLLMRQWATLTYKGRVTLNGDLVQKITGEYRENPNGPANGQFEIYVSEAGDFLRYVVYQRFVFPNQTKEPIDVKTVWDSSIKLGVKTDENLYRVVQ